MSESHDATEPALERFVFFSDAVFAIAITLLVIEIKAPPAVDGLGERAWEGILIHLWPSLFAFVLTFLVVGSVWAAHHAVFRLVSRFSDALILPNLILLMLVALVPFSSALLSERTIAPAPYAFYSLTLVAVGLAKVWVTRIALRPGLVSSNVSARSVVVARRASWLLPGAAALALVLAFIVPAWNNLAMLLIMLGRRLPYFRGSDQPPEHRQS